MPADDQSLTRKCGKNHACAADAHEFSETNSCGSSAPFRSPRQTLAGGGGEVPGTPLRVLIGCEESGVMRRAFRELGHGAWSCDFQPARDGSPHHYQCDVREVWGMGWDLIILHPVCKYLTNAGVRWLYNADGSRDIDRWQRMETAAGFFRECLNAPAPFVAVENPVMHGHAQKLIGQKFKFSTQPWMFGDDFKKRSCWWGNLPRLEPTSCLDGSTAYAKVHRMPPGPDREMLRSETEPGLAKAAAQQWGDYVSSAILHSRSAA